MDVFNLPQAQALKQALEIIAGLKVAENMQPTALEYLLSFTGGEEKKIIATLPAIYTPQHQANGSTADLRSFIEEYKPVGAVSEIPCLMYWAKTNEDKISVDEAEIIELYRRAKRKPPKNVVQSFRDLCSKKYGRLVAAESGRVALSRVGEDFVLHDVKKN